MASEETELDVASSLSLFKKLAVQESNLLLRYTNSLSLQTLLTPSRLRSISSGSSVFSSHPSLPSLISDASLSDSASLRLQLADVQSQLSFLLSLVPSEAAIRASMLQRVQLGNRALATVGDARQGTDVKTAALLAVRYWEMEA